MQFNFPVRKPSQLAEETERVHDALKDLNPGTEKYDDVVDQLTKLYKLQEITSKKRVSPDTWVSVGGSLLGVVVVVAYEHAHPVVSKALSSVMRSVK